MYEQRLSPRIWLRMISFLVLALFLAACTGAGVQPAAVDTPAEGGEAQPDDVVTITWWTETAGLPENFEEVFVEAFEAENPGINLEIIGQESLNDTLRTAIQAGEAPDILQTPGASFIAEFVEAGLVLPLDESADELSWEDKLLGWAFQSGRLGENLYSVPLTYESMVLFYNKTLFEEKGWEPPTTFAELNAVAEAAVDAEIHPFAYGNGTWQPANEHLMGIYLNNYAGPQNVYQALTGQKSWTDEEFVGATDLLRQHIADNGWFSGSLENYFANGGDDSAIQLATGEAAMMMSGTWNFRSLGTFFEEAGTEWDWVPLPAFSEIAGEYNYELATGSTLSVNAASEHPHEAIAVIDFLLSDPVRVLEMASVVGFGEWVIPIHFTPNDFPSGTDERVVRFFSDFAAVTGEGRIGYTTWTFWPAAPNVHLWEDVELVWFGEKSVEEYLTEHQALWDEVPAAGRLPVPEPGQ